MAALRPELTFLDSQSSMQGLILTAAHIFILWTFLKREDGPEKAAKGRKGPRWRFNELRWFVLHFVLFQ